MAKTTPKIKDIGQNLEILSDGIVELGYLTAVNGAPGGGQFRSDIVGRASIPDITNDLLPRMGSERIQTQHMMLADGEYDSAGQPVYRHANDKFDRLRFVGSWGPFNGAVNADGQYVQSSSTTSYFEVVFIGTGLNALVYTDTSNRSMAVSIDGAGEVTVNNVSNSNVLQGRKYSTNCIINLASGLTYGLHTIRVRQTNSTVTLFGVDILNESSNIRTNPGIAYIKGKKVIRTSIDSQPYNSGFESGTLGIRGGRVVVYLKSDGTIAKAVTPTDASSLALGAANHTNEEIIRSYFWREFGSGRTDDFSTLNTISNRAFTLDDGVTTLVGSNVLSITLNNINALITDDLADFYTLTFVGTGLDILMTDGAGGSRHFEAFVDGVSVGTSVVGLVNSSKVFKIVSGLPYGTHTVRIKSNLAGNGTHGVVKFITYGPKKPEVPEDAIELADYNILADFVANTTASVDHISTGVYRRQSLRDMVMSGAGWVIDASVQVNHVNGRENRTNGNGDKFRFQFWGEGFEHRWRGDTNGASLVTFTLNGTLLTAANFPTAVFNAYGPGIAFNSGTGVLDADASVLTGGCGFSVSGLDLGFYTLEMTNGNTEFMKVDCIDVITPIHVHKDNGPFTVKNTLPVGSQGISDNRNFGDRFTESPASFNAKGVTTDPSETVTTFVPLPDLSGAIKTSGGALDISFNAVVLNVTANAAVRVVVFVDGVEAGRRTYHQSAVASNQSSVAGRVLYPVAAGWHYVQVYWSKDSGTSMSSTADWRELSVTESKK